MLRSFPTPTVMFVESPKHLICAALAGALLLTTAPAAAQESTPEAGVLLESTPTAEATPEPESTPETGATPEAAIPNELGTVLMSHEFDDLPEAPMTVRLLRITLEPGASVPMHTHTGHELDLVETGTLTVSIDGTAVTSVDGELSDASETQSLSPGSWIVYPEGTGMSFANEGSENVEILSSVILAVGGENQETITYTDSEPDDSDFEGVSYVVLGDGLIQQFPLGGATVTVDQLTVAADDPIPGFSGSALLSKTVGEFAFAAGTGEVQVTRTSAEELRPNAIPGQEFTLDDNDAAFFPSGYQAIERPDGEGDLELTRLLIEPSEPLSNAPAEVTVIQPSDESESAETDASEGDGLGVGAIIALSEDGVRVRQEATTDSNIVDGFEAGTQFELIDGPVEGEDFVWYAVRGVGDLSDVEGWLVTDFMDVVEPAPAEGQQPATDGSAGSEDAADDSSATPEATAEPESTPVPVTLEIGDIVATTDENVRLRFEPDTGTDIVVALPTGTELEVIGGPEENQDFTWYEVAVVDGEVTGWTIAEFLEPVEAGEEGSEG